MVEDPVHYRWTSYRANGLGPPDARLTPHTVYLSLGPARRSDRRRIALCFARSWMVPPSMTYALRSIRASRWVIRDSWTK